MKHVVAASSREMLMDSVDELYSEVCDYFENYEVADEILNKWGANERDDGPEGFLTGVSEDQMRGMIKDFKQLLRGGSELVSRVVFDDPDDIETLYNAVSNHILNFGPHTSDELYYLNRVLDKLKRS